MWDEGAGELMVVAEDDETTLFFSAGIRTGEVQDERRSSTCADFSELRRLHPTAARAFLPVHSRDCRAARTIRRWARMCLYDPRFKMGRRRALVKTLLCRASPAFFHHLCRDGGAHVLLRHLLRHHAGLPAVATRTALVLLCLLFNLTCLLACPALRPAARPGTRGLHSLRKREQRVSQAGVHERTQRRQRARARR
jgi:hypothetical protein